MSKVAKKPATSSGKGAIFGFGRMGKPDTSDI